jgi:non-specific serine/threonine protein kinase
MKRWTFGDFVLDLDTHALVRAGTPVSLSPKAWQLLGILVENRPRALSRVELQDRLWPGTFVVEKNLTNLVSEIREALGDDPVHPRFVRTVHRFGYAFLDASAAESRDSEASAFGDGSEGASLGARRHNLPVPITNFIGRDQELAELRQLVASTRLLTLTGAGGCGKTRLALELAANLLDRFSDGVWVVDLAALTDPNLVPQAVASVLDVREGPSRPIGDALPDYVRNRQILLVFDNCEHLIAATAHLAESLLRAALRLCILVTSREQLGITGETTWRVSSLSVPGPLQAVSPENLAMYDAVRLFVERAAAADPAFTVTVANAATVAQVCVRLDGIPLALELAAARVKVLSIEQIDSRLNDRFRLLTGGSRSALARQRTLRATVDWSYNLLSDPERQLLRRLSVFAGGWTMQAAEEVTSGNGSEREDVLDALSRLVDKSLVNVDADEGRRYRFLETVRQYARELLVQSGEAERLRDRHLAFFHELLRQAEPELTRAGQVTWLSRLHREHDNLRLALEWCLTSPGRGEQVVEFAASLCWFWIKGGHCREGQGWLERALSIGGSPSVALRAKALMSLGSLTFFQGDLVRSRTLLEESAALGRAAGDLSVAGFSLGMQALAALELGDIGECLRLATEGQAAARASMTPWMQGPALACLAYVAMHQGDFDRAGRLHEEALEVTRRQGEKWGMGISLSDLALLRVVQHRHAEAKALCAEGIVLYEELRDRLGIAWCLGVLSGAEADGDPLRAARLRGAMEGLLESAGAPVQASYHKWIGDRCLALMKDRLGDSVLQAALAEGRSMSRSRAIQFGLEHAAS